MTSSLRSSSLYSSTPAAASLCQEVIEQAVEWLIALEDEPVPAHVVDQWRAWRHQHPDHELAWQRIEAVKGNLQPVLDPTTAAVAQVTLTQAALGPKRSKQRRRAIKALALLLTTGATAYTLRESTPWRSWTADYRTQVGERRTLVLDDGTQLVMNTDTAINVRFSTLERRIALVSGEILIRTAHGPDTAGRPFLVETAQGTATALGTWYAVRQDALSTLVSVFDGDVRIQPRQMAASARVVHGGEQASYTQVDASPPVPTNESRIAWRHGFIEAHGMRLDDFLADLSRYSEDPITCDPAVAAMKVSGSFPTASIDRVLQSLAATLNLRADRVTRIWGRGGVRMVPVGAARGDAA